MRIERHWRPNPVDETCKLYLHPYKHGGEIGSVMPDTSTSHNDGTIAGAVPGTYPMFNPVELMPNQVDRDFSGASAWANVDINAYNETDDLTITANAANQYCTCPVASVPTTIGKRYRLYYDLANIVQTWTVKSFDATQTIGTISANVTQGFLDWVASTTGGLRLVAVANTSSGDFDNFSLKEITGYQGPGWYFDIVDDYVTTTALSNLMTISTGSFLVWCTPMTGAPVTLTYYAGNSILQDTDGYFTICQTTVGGLDRIWIALSDTAWRVVGIPYTVGEPICLGWVHSGGNLYGYKNGVLVDSVVAGDIGAVTGVLRIGDTDNSVGFGGIVSELLSFNRALSAQEIRNHYEMTRHIFN